MPTDHDADDPRSRRLARNEAFFRETNEMLVREAAGWYERMFDCICECSRRGCMVRLAVTTAEYESVRAHGDRFVVARGHDDPAIEVVVESFGGYLVMQKRAEPARSPARQTRGNSRSAPRLGRPYPAFPRNAPTSSRRRLMRRPSRSKSSSPWCLASSPR
jgi:hypothetical protein